MKGIEILKKMAAEAEDKELTLRLLDEFGLEGMMGPWGYLDDTTQPTLDEWIDKPHLSANSHPSLHEWMESREWHDGLALLGGIPERASWIYKDYPVIQRAHELLAQAIKSALDSCKGCNPNGDAFRFIQGILRLYVSEDNVASTVLALREIAGRIRGPYAATLSKLYMFGFKVERDPQEALRWVALSGEPERFVENSTDGTCAELKRSWLIWSFVRFFMLEGDETEAAAWANLSASNPIFFPHKTTYSVFAFIDDGEETWGDKGWHGACAGVGAAPKTSAVVRSYEILRELLDVAESERGYAPTLRPDSALSPLGFGLHERIHQLPPPEASPQGVDRGNFFLERCEFHYTAAFQFSVRTSDQTKYNCWTGVEGSLPEAPIDDAEALVHIVLLYDIRKAVACCSDAESALAIINYAVSNDMLHVPNHANWWWWSQKEYRPIIESLLKRITQEDVLRAIKRLQTTTRLPTK